MMERIIDEDSIAIANANINWERLTHKTVLIAGANGYVPQFFVHGLLKRNDLYGSGIQVVALCRNREKAMERFGEYIDRNDFQLILQDVSTRICYSEKIDFIIHAASPAGIKLTMEKPLDVFNANVIGCNNLLSLAREKKARFLYISSVDVYGTMKEMKRIKEEDMGVIDHISLRNVYAASKRMAETLCMSYRTEGVDIVVVRPSQIMGPGISLNDERLHINMISQLLSGDSIVLKGDGTPKRTFIYVTDAIIGMMTVLTGGANGEVYNVCTESCEATVRKLAEVMCGLLKDRTTEITYNMKTRTSDPAVTQVVSMVCTSSEKLRALGWNADVDLQSACKRMMKYYGLKV